MQQDEAALLEEVVDGAGGGVAHAQHRADGVGARAQVGDVRRNSKEWRFFCSPATSTSSPVGLDGEARADLAQLALEVARDRASATTCSPAKQEPSLTSRNETPFECRAVFTQPCTEARPPALLRARIWRTDSLTRPC